MEKENIHDIVPPGQRSIRKVTLSGRSKKNRTLTIPEETHELGKRKRRGGPSRIGVWVIAVVSVLILIFGFSFLFTGAKVTVFPKQNNVLVDSTFTTNSGGSLGGLKHEIMKIEKEKTVTVKATGEEEVDEKASGKIVVFNDFNSSSQRLIKNTRFETPDGLIYRIQKSVIVPGQKEEGGETVPGSIEVEVFADESGEKYNIDLTDFTIPGFKGSPQFEGFFARSKTPMTGGFSGKRLTVEGGELEKKKIEAREELRAEIQKEATSQIPEGFHLFEDALFVEFESLPQKDTGDDVEIEEKATLYGVLFENDLLAEYIAQNTIAGFESGSVELTSKDDLVFSVNDKENTKPWLEGQDSFSFSVKGNTQVVWLFDEEQLRIDLSGRSKDALVTILSGYPSIDRAEVIIRPFWKRSFPDEVTKIKVDRMIES